MVQDELSTDRMVNMRAAARNGAEAMVRFILQRIDEGVWKPGEKLPTERELANQFRISRNTLRKHLLALEAKGRIARQVGSGTYVTKTSAAPLRGTVATAPDGLLARIHGASPAEVMEFRLLIEPQMVELSVSRATVEDLREIDTCVLRCEAADSVEEFEHWDGAFHLVLIRAARNQLVTDLYATINGVRQQALWGRMKERTLTTERRRLYENQHRCIAAALHDRDINQTREALKAHLLAVRDSLLGA